MEYTKATQIAATLGQGMALLFGIVGLFSNVFLLFIALFVWIGAAQEASMAQMKSALGGIPIRRAMLTDFRTLSPQDSLARAVELILSGSQHDFPIVDNNRVEGILTRNDLMTGLARRGQESPVAEAMRRDFQIVEETEMLETAFARLHQCECKTVPVILMLQVALGGTKGGRPEKPPVPRSREEFT